jgi:hypothetical protein
MKQPHQYDTPETDAKIILILSELQSETQEVIMAEYARDLEQRLAACRDALTKILKATLKIQQADDICAEALNLTSQKMTPEKQRIAIAEALGWIDCHRSFAGFDDGDGIMERRYIGIPPNHLTHRQIPYYLSDLDAMAEAEKVLDNNQAAKYVQTLTSIASQSDKPAVAFLTATAAQRARAFLETLNLWKL